jgi:hypothetical protein
MLIFSMLLHATVAMEPESVAAPEPLTNPAMEESLEPSDALLWETRKGRAKDFRAQMMTGRKAQMASHDGESLLRKKRTEARRVCAERLRKANRNERFSALLLCVKQDLTTTLEGIRRRQDGLGVRAGVSSDTTSLIRARGDLLIDALDAVIQAIDAGVYSNEEDLFEVRNNLRDKYILPYSALLPRSDTEHALAGIAHMLIRSRDMDRSGFPDEVLSSLEKSDACLAAVEKGVESLAAAESINAGHRTEIRNCLAQYREAQVLMEKLSVPVPEEPQEPEWQKRSLRRLPKTRN